MKKTQPNNKYISQQQVIQSISEKVLFFLKTYFYL